MTGTLAPEFAQQYFDNNGDPLASGKVYTYAAGTSDALATYTSATLAVANANPVILDSAGRASIFLGPYSYKFVLKTSADVTVLTVDGVAAVPLTNIDLDITGVAGQDLATNDSVFMSDGTGGNTAGRWYKTDSDATLSSTDAKILGFAPAAFLTGETGSIRRAGRVTGMSGLNPGTDYYISATAGAITSTPPANAVLVATADSTTSVVIPAKIPDASATIKGLVNTGAQTFAGVKTLSSAPVLSAGAVFSAFPTGLSGMLFSRSTADATYNATVVLANITGLSFAIGANETWIFDFVMTGVSADVADYQFALTGPAAPTSVNYAVVSSQDAPTTSAANAFGGVVAASGAGATPQGLILSGIVLNGANAGTVQLQAAQLVSNASNTVIRANSYVKAIRVA